jgi:hypothetical protein
MPAHKREEVFTLQRKRVSVEVEVENCDSGVLAPGEAAATIRWREAVDAERVVRDFTDIAVVEVECMGLMPWAVDRDVSNLLPAAASF